MSGLTPDAALAKCEKIYMQGKRRVITHKDAMGMFAEVLLDLHETSFDDGVDHGIRAAKEGRAFHPAGKEAHDNRRDAIDGIILP